MIGMPMPTVVLSEFVSLTWTGWAAGDADVDALVDDPFVPGELDPPFEAAEPCPEVPDEQAASSKAAPRTMARTPKIRGLRERKLGFVTRPRYVRPSARSQPPRPIHSRRSMSRR
jgi:hypothetical protein